MFRLFPLILWSLAFLAGCSSTPKSDSSLAVSFEEFLKILSPRSMALVEGEDRVLMTIAREGDIYPKLYSYSYKTKKFSLEYDHGQGISSVSRDDVGENYYLHIDNKGDENFKIYGYDLKSKKPNLVFGKDKFQSYLVGSDKTGETLFIASNFENKSIYSIYTFPLKTKKLSRISDGKTNLMSGIVSPDGKTFFAIRSQSNNQNIVYKIDVRSQKMTTLFQKKNSVFNPQFLGPKGQYLYGDSDAGRDRMGCGKIALNKPNSVNYALKDSKADVYCSFGRLSNLYFVTKSSRGKRTLSIYKSMFKDPITVPEVFNNQSVGTVGYDRKTSNLLLKFSAANNPGSLYSFNIHTKKNDFVLNYNQSKIPVSDLATSFDFDYKSFDGMDIHGIIYAKPGWKTSGKKYPLVVWPHGGPDSSESHSYRKWFQYLVLNDFVVFAPNFRGSTGYGKKFETLNDKDWGGKHIQDVVAGKDAVTKLSWIDGNNAFLYGGSFGGFSVLSTVTRHPKAFKAAVGFVAIGNLFTFMDSIPPDEAWQSEFRKEIGDPVKDKALYRERSPFFHVDKIAIPLQIYQAENDIRTVKSEMDVFVEEMKKKGKPVEYTVLKDVGHGIARPEAQKQVAEGAAIFFKSKM